MEDMTAMLTYDLVFRIRLYITSKLAEAKPVNDLNDREAIILERVGASGTMSISEISHFFPQLSKSTISTTITKLWKDKKLVGKKYSGKSTHYLRLFDCQRQRSIGAI